MLNMSIILFRYKQFASKIYNAISMYYFICKLITDLHNSIHFITGLNHMLKSSVRFGSAKKVVGSVRVRQKFLVRSFPSYNKGSLRCCSKIFEFEHVNWQKSDCSGFEQISISYTDKTKTNSGR